jgi:hypothetical protein
VPAIVVMMPVCAAASAWTSINAAIFRCTYDTITTRRSQIALSLLASQKKLR